MEMRIHRKRARERESGIEKEEKRQTANVTWWRDATSTNPAESLRKYWCGQSMKTVSIYYISACYSLNEIWLFIYIVLGFVCFSTIHWLIVVYTLALSSAPFTPFHFFFIVKRQHIRMPSFHHKHHEYMHGISITIQQWQIHAYFVQSIHLFISC